MNGVLKFVAIIATGFFSYNLYAHGSMLPETGVHKSDPCQEDPTLFHTRECVSQRVSEDFVMIGPDEKQSIDNFIMAQMQRERAGTYNIPVADGKFVTVKIEKTNPRFCPRVGRNIHDMRSNFEGNYAMVTD